jgi:hypothetical protein
MFQKSARKFEAEAPCIYYSHIVYSNNNEAIIFSQTSTLIVYNGLFM